MTLLRKLTLALIALFCVPLMHAQSNSIISGVKLTFTTIDVPGAGYTGVSSINKTGDMVGDYGQNTNNGANGFLYSNGTFTYFDYPGATVTVPLGINDSGLIVGYAGKEPVVGFLYDGTTFTTLQDGSDSATFARGINNAGVVVGGAGTIYTTRAFEMRGSRFQPVKVPGQFVYVFASGINNSGEVAGFTDVDGFVCLHGSCQIVDFPGATQTSVQGINDSPVIVGWYEKGPPYAFYGFALRNGKFISFTYPGAMETFASGINASGQIVGSYQLSDYSYHGFVTSPITAADFERPGCCQMTADETAR